MPDGTYEHILSRKNYVTFRCSEFAMSENFLVNETPHNGQTDRATRSRKCKIMHCAQVTKYLIVRRRCINYPYNLTSVIIMYKQISC